MPNLVPLGALVRDGQISYGIVQPGTDGTEGVPIVRVRDVRNGVIDITQPLRVDAQIASKHNKTKLRGGELLLSLVGTVGESAVVPEALAGWNVARAIAVINPVGVSARWLQLCFESAPVRDQVQSLLNTTVQATLNLSDLKTIAIPMPAERDRRAIAEVLGALDDKIAANTKLAETADALVVSKFQNSLLTASYSESTFADLARVSGGGTPSTKVPEYWDGSIPWATPTDITGLQGPYLEETSRTISEAGLAACSSELFPAETILMTSRATIGAFALTQTPTAVNQGFIVVQAYDPDLHFWLFHEMRGRVEEFISMANGATFLELSRGNFKKFKVRLAEQSEMKAFNETARILHQSAREALQENRTLAATRDTLLPQLMSGKLRVSDLDRISPHNNI